jgi:16S rRNA processing protein RimM
MVKVTELMSNRFRNPPATDLLHVATLGRIVGLKGDMKLNLHTDFPEQFVKNATFTTDKGGEVKIQNYNPDRELVKLVGYDTPEAAKALTNTQLFTTSETTRERCNLSEGEFFWFDLIGLDVMEGDLSLGKVQEIERIGPLDYLLVTTAPALVAKGLAATFLIPYIDHFINNSDTESKVIHVTGGLDLLEAS